METQHPQPVEEIIVQAVLEYYPAVQGIYLFGSHGTEHEWPDSDVDIALLLPHDQAREEKSLMMSPCRCALERKLRKDVDLLNARRVSTVFQKEIIQGRVIYCRDPYAMDEFEMLVLSLYQKLNEERREILASFFETGRTYEL